MRILPALEKHACSGPHDLQARKGTARKHASESAYRYLLLAAIRCRHTGKFEPTRGTTLDSIIIRSRKRGSERGMSAGIMEARELWKSPTSSAELWKSPKPFVLQWILAQTSTFWGEVPHFHKRGNHRGMSAAILEARKVWARELWNPRYVRPVCTASCS